MTTKEKKETSVAVKAPAYALSAETLIGQAIANNATVDTMERLLAMRRELKAEWAKERFDISMASFQAECPTIQKKKEGGKTKGGTVAYKYAPLDAIVNQTKALIQKHGFSYAFQTQTLASGVKVTCTAKHKSGHSESSDMEVPLGTKTDIMSSPQVTAAAITFAKRYAFCNTFGILTGDEDNDAALPPETQGNAPKMSPEEKFEAAKKMIGSVRDVGALIAYEERMNNGKAFSKEQKETLTKLIKDRANALDAQQG